MNLRQRRLSQWSPDSKEAMAVRDVPKVFKLNQSDQAGLTDLTDQQRWELYAAWLEHADPAVRANALICLINQANFLLDQQIAAVEKQFMEQGGYSEQLAVARLAERERVRRDQSDLTDRTDRTDQIPQCPKCGSMMVLRTVRSGKNAGRQFWGCSSYPDCKGLVEL